MKNDLTLFPASVSLSGCWNLGTILRIRGQMLHAFHMPVLWTLVWSWAADNTYSQTELQLCVHGTSPADRALWGTWEVPTFSAIRKSERRASRVQMAPSRKAKTMYRNHLQNPRERATIQSSPSQVLAQPSPSPSLSPAQPQPRLQPTEPVGTCVMKGGQP